MSYPGYPNYSLYYGTSQNEQGYPSGRPSGNTSYPDPVVYSTESRQAQYTSQEYLWPTPSRAQQSYNTNNNDEAGQNASVTYQERTQSQSYDYQRAHPSHVGSNKRQAEIQAYTNSVNRTPTQSSMQALNELAHVSGLESSGLQAGAPARNIQPPQRNNTPQDSAVSQSQAANSNSDSYAHQTYKGQVEASQYDKPDVYQHTGNNNELLLQAAAALQGASRNARANATSPTTSNTRTIPASQQRSQSPSVSSKKATLHQQSQSLQRCSNKQSYSASQTNIPTVPGQTQLTRPQQSYSVTPNGANQAALWQTNSMANLVTNDSRQEGPAHPSPTEQTSTTFINPREVFNPYHKEHKRARKDAAAAEAAATRKAAEEDQKAKNIAQVPPTVRPIPAPAAPVSSPNISKSKPKANLKAKAVKSQSVGETDTEAELRQMLARMKELRNKDSALFQKVWDEEKRGKTSGASTAKPQNQLTVTQTVPFVESTSQPAKSPSQPDQDIPRGFNGYPVVVENNPEGLPDLGKFPAARRVRYSYNIRKQPTQVSLAVSIQLENAPAPPATAVNVPTQSAPLVFNPNVIQGDMATTHPLPPRDKDGSTVWPAAQRQTLANSTVKFLMLDPRNEGLTITETSISDMLSSNPSYVDLCRLLEARGFRFDRRKLARTLLDDNSALGPAKNGSQPLRSPSQAQDARSQPLSPAAFSPLAANQGLPFVAGSFIKSETQPKRIVFTTPVTGRQNIPMASQSRSHLSVSAPQCPPPAPGSKEDMARKRGFEDLIDLTNEDEDYVVPEKRARLRSPSPDPISSFAVKAQPPEQISSFVRYGSPSAQGMLPKSITPLRFDAHIPGTLPESSSSQPSKVIFAKKLNKAEALRRNYYDPKTVARDFLISIGRHPTERPLNAHLAGLLGTHIDLDSDLSTFRWEDIDPGGPPTPKQPWTDVPAGPPRFKSRTTTGKIDPDTPRQKARKLNSDLSRGKGLIDFTNGLAAKGHITAGHKRWMHGSKQNGQMPRPSALTQSLLDSGPQFARRVEEGLRNLARQTKKLVTDSIRQPARQISQLHQSQTDAEGVSLGSQAAPPNKRGRGRPPKASRLPAEPSLPPLPPPPSSIEAHSEKRSVEPHRSPPSSQVRKTSTKPPASIHSSRRSDSADTHTMEKRRSRPPGIKNKVPSGERIKMAGELQVVVPRFRAEDDTPEYPVFKCRWVKCGTELHNIPTLRKHIAKLHKPPQDTVDEIGYGCYWKKCSLLRKDDDGNIEPTPIGTEEEWLDHINEEHIYPLGRKYGDGPSTSHIGKQKQSFETLVSRYIYKPSLFLSDARISSHTDPQAVASDRAIYLTDEQGRATTHLAHSDDEPDAVVLTDIHTNDIDHNEAADAAFKAFLKNHSHHKKDLKATTDEMLRAMAARKEKIGVGIDRGGCTLVNEERRRTFVQNPGVSRVVDYDY